MKVLGIDPGKRGGLVLVDGTDILEMHTIPTRYDKNAKPKTSIDWQELMKTIDSIDFDVVFIEKVIGRGGRGANMIFNFGYTCGFLSGALSCQGTLVNMVTPKEWQKEQWIKGDIVYQDPNAKRRAKDTKKTSLNAATRIFNVEPEFFLSTPKSTVPHDGLYDAALIANYGHKSMLGLV